MLSHKTFRAYDIRAIAPELVDKESAYYNRLEDPDLHLSALTKEDVRRIGWALARFFNAKSVAIGKDARLSSESWAAALAEGLISQGVEVIDLGQTTTDAVYFVSGAWEMPAVQITASHCTKEINGMKLVRPGARVVGKETGMEELAELALSAEEEQEKPGGRLVKRDPLPEYVAHLLTFVQPKSIAPIKIIADAGNGMGGVVADELLKRLPQVKVKKMFFQPDGNYPNHPANPFEPENSRQIRKQVVAERADMGIAWDGDADRACFIDEKGQQVFGDLITALIARELLKDNPGAKIVYDLRSSWAVEEWVRKSGGEPAPERVGHAFIKERMRQEKAVFGGEISGHYYFRENFYADNGFIPWLIILRVLSQAKKPFSHIIAELGEYHLSGEINLTVEDAQQTMQKVAERYKDGKSDWRDGLSVFYPDWHFNLRPSANDPVIRLTLEAKSQREMEKRRDEVLALIKE